VDGAREATGRLCTSIGRICPVSVTRVIAWSSMVGFHWGSARITTEAGLHVEPTPAASIWLTGTARHAAVSLVARAALRPER
jgi:hypothetical protein